MMNLIDEYYAHCPWCGERISLIVDVSACSDIESFRYIEDCSVCCQPIVVEAGLMLDLPKGEHEGINLQLRRECD